ncbi:type II toxin-antitoxin system RelB/DinJ family antitoxin [Enterococcus sp. AZ109]|uniref:type II toxin-antitoxin system RelB/DinJ family antitoxin n=1 Tax=Enterococcus sp. AZ109 TaxID=2774634 RepID=UPI003F268CF7
MYKFISLKEVTLMKTKERLNVNLDKDLKEETAKILDELGLDYTTAITMYFKQIVNKKKILLKFQLKNTTLCGRGFWR